MMFKAIPIEKDSSNYRAGVKDVDYSELPPGDVTVHVVLNRLVSGNRPTVDWRGKRE